MFKIGDRVRVYNGGILTGTISYINADGTHWLEIQCDKDNLIHGPYHFKQCRKLVKKKAPDLEQALISLRHINSGPITHERYRQMKLLNRRRWKQIQEVEKDLSKIIEEIKQIINTGKTFESSTKTTILQDLDYFYSFWKKYE